MPIRTQSLEQATRKFIDSYKAHLFVNSAASRIDPRDCNQCSSAFEDLVFAYDGASLSHFNVVETDDDKYIVQFPPQMV